MLKKIIVKHPKNRYSLDQYMEHKWFDEIRDADAALIGMQNQKEASYS